MTVKLNRKIARKVLETIDAGLVKGVGIPKPGKMCIEAAVCYALGLPHGDNPDDCVAKSLQAMNIALGDQSWRNAAARAKGMRRLGIAQLGSKGMDEKEFLRRLSEFTVGAIVPRALRSVIKVGADPTLEAFAVRCEKEKSYEAAIAADVAVCTAANPAYVSAGGAAFCAASCAAGVDAIDFVNAAARALRAAHAAAYAAHATDYAADYAYAAHAAAHAKGRRIGAAIADAEREFFAEGVVQILVKMKVAGTKWLDLTE